MKNPSVVIASALLVCSIVLIAYLLTQIMQTPHVKPGEDLREQQIRKQIKENPNIGRIMLITPIPSPCRDNTVYDDIQSASQSPRGPEDVCTFDLKSRNLKKLPSEIKIFKNLSTIGLRNNGLTEFPAELLTLTRLTRIGLMENNISSIPNGINNLKNLQVLNLGNNKLSTLPDTLGMLENLEHLILDNNYFTALPKSTYKLKKLKTLSLIGNPLSNLEKGKIKKSFPNTKVIFEL